MCEGTAPSLILLHHSFSSISLFFYHSFLCVPSIFWDCHNVFGSFFLSFCLSFFLAWPLWRLSQKTYAETDVLRTQNNNQFHRLAHIRVSGEREKKILLLCSIYQKNNTQNKLRGSLLGAAGLG